MRAVAINVMLWIVGFLVAVNVMNRCGRELGLAILATSVVIAWAGHTDRSRWMVGRLMEIAEQRLTAKGAASICGISAPTWSAWKSGKEQASFSRLAELPDAVWDEFEQERLEGRGFAVVPSGRVASATLAVLRFAAAVEASAPATLPRQEVA